MAGSNLKEIMLEDNNEDIQHESQTDGDSSQKLPWYLIDSDKTFCKTWNFIITIVTIYSLVATPFLLVYPTVYAVCMNP